MIVDAHVHHWALARGDYGWLTPDLDVLHRDLGGAEYAAAGGAANRILVQAAPTVAETRYLLSLAGDDPGIVGVVGWVPLNDPGAPDALGALASDPHLVGIRPMLQDIDDTEWVLRAECAATLRRVAELDLVFELLIQPRHLDVAQRLLGANPSLRAVLCHAAKPDIAGAAFEPWASGIAALAGHPNVSCKLSGLVTEAGAEWSVATLRPYVDHLLATFGADRLIWGSDWPVLNLAATYTQWRATTDELLAHLDDAARAAINGTNAQAVYRYGRRR